MSARVAVNLCMYESFVVRKNCLERRGGGGGGEKSWRIWRTSRISEV